MPSPVDGGRDLAPVRNPVTGLFDFQWDSTGNPTFDDTEAHTVLSLLLEYEGGYWADPTGKRGSRLHEVKHDITSTASDLKAFIEAALQPALDDGRLLSLTVEVARVKPGRYSANIRYRNRNGHEQNTKLPFGG